MARKNQKNKLVEKFEKETGKNAFWRGRETGNFKKWKKTNPTNPTRPKRIVKRLKTVEEKVAKKKEILLKNLRDSSSIVKLACYKTGIDRETYYRWYKADPEFAKKCDEIDEGFNLVVEDKIKEGIVNNDSAMIRFHASARNPKYKNKVGIEAGDGVEISMNIKVADEGANKN